MSRLTYKLDEPIKTKYLNYEYNRIKDYDIDRCNFGRITDDMIFNKLGKLEDIEEQLGVDLITLFKALNVRDGVWVKDKEYGLCNWSMGQLWFGYNSSKSESFINPQIYFLKDGGYSYFKLSDYGKTCALTKEELENE